MKQLRFIIPGVLNQCCFVRAKGILLLLVLWCFAFSAVASSHDFGCRIGERIFQNLDTVHRSPTNFQVDSDGNGYPNGFSVVNDRCDNGNTTPCTVYEFDEVNTYGIGYLADFSLEYCPIDNYVPAMIIFIVCLMIVNIMARKQNYA
jgi:hypothetical protein